MKKHDVSVVIPTWNRKDDLKRTLKSVFSQSFKPKEVIVVDNGSKDGSVEMVKKQFKKVILIENSLNRGTSFAKNQGIKKATGYYVLFCDSDIEMVHKNVIKNMIGLMDSHPKIGALGGEAYKTENGVETKKKDVTINCETSTIIMPKKEYHLEECGYVATCNCMMRRDLLLKLRGFDSAIIYAGEDKELGIKVAKQGLKNIIDSSCLVYHYISQSTKHRNFYGFNKNRIRIVIKNYGFFRIITLPLLDIISVFDPKKFSDMKSSKVDIAKWAGEKKKSKIRNILSIGLKYAVSLIAAYAWNIVHLPQTLVIRFKKVNYLEN